MYEIILKLHPRKINSNKISQSIKKCINNSVSYIKKTNRPFALVVKKNTFSKYSTNSKNKSNLMKREDVLEYIVSQLSKDDIIVDNVDQPKIFYGICNGKGDFVRKLTVRQSKIIKNLKNKYKLKI